MYGMYVCMYVMYTMYVCIVCMYARAACVHVAGMARSLLSVSLVSVTQPPPPPPPSLCVINLFLAIIVFGLNFFVFLFS